VRAILSTSYFLLFMAVTTPVMGQQAAGVTIAVLRDDGTLVPFAQYQQGNWLNPWPKPEGYYSSNTIADLPKPWFSQSKALKATWYSWSTKGGAKPLTTSNVVQVDNDCQKNWGLQSNASSPVKGNYPQHIGFATDTKLQADGLIEVSDSSERSEIIALLAPLFEKAESGALAKKVTATKRKAGRLAISHLYRSPEVKGKSLYYIEATKEYPVPVDPQSPDCKVTSLFTGWLSKVASKREVLQHNIEVTDCEMMEAANRIPLGMLQVDNRVFIVAEDSTGETHSYSIYEWTGSGVQLLLETSAGGC
jgi:hypothetical protein